MQEEIGDDAGELPNAVIGGTFVIAERHIEVSGWCQIAEKGHRRLGPKGRCSYQNRGNPPSS